MRQSGSAPVLEPAAWPVWLGEVAGEYAALLRPAKVGRTPDGELFIPTLDRNLRLTEALL